MHFIYEKKEEWIIDENTKIYFQCEKYIIEYINKDKQYHLLQYIALC